MKEFLVTFFFGWLGVHRFMKKQYGIGALYLCTLGLCGIGWTVDTILALVRLVKGEQNAPNPKTNDCSGGGKTYYHSIRKAAY